MKVFGREQFIDSIWNSLEEKSLLLTAERRIGKTVVLKEMLAHPRDNYIVIYSDLEKNSTPIEFVNDVVNSLAPYTSQTQKASEWWQLLTQTLGGAEIGGMIKFPESQTPHWKDLLTKVITNVCEYHRDKTFLFLWDEMPYMLQKIELNSQPDNHYSGLAILDVLRALRMDTNLPNLRMILTGSIGLHHVITTLKKGKLSTEPVNDLDKIHVPKLSMKHAKAMAEYRLVEKEKLHKSPDDILLQTICEECDCIPHYIEQAIKHCAKKEDFELTPESFKQEIDTILLDGDDSWEMSHFRSRLKEYYQGQLTDAQGHSIEKHQLAKALLNHIAVSSEPQSLKACFQAIKNEFSLAPADKDEINSLLTLLIKDHYLIKIPKQGYQFNFTLVKRWWLEAEGLI